MEMIQTARKAIKKGKIKMYWNFTKNRKTTYFKTENRKPKMDIWVKPKNDGEKNENWKTAILKPKNRISVPSAARPLDHPIMYRMSHKKIYRHQKR